MELYRVIPDFYAGVRVLWQLVRRTVISAVKNQVGWSVASAWQLWESKHARLVLDAKLRLTKCDSCLEVL